MNPLTGVYKKRSFKVLKQMNCSGADLPHTCGLSCLGHLTFHTEAVGDRITLTHGARRAARARDTFRNGVVFSNRPIRVREKVQLRVDHSVSNWHGALRLGFTNIRPDHECQADMAIPNLIKELGYWAAPVPEEHALPGSVLQFWVSSMGKLMYKGQDGQKYQLLLGVDLSKPLWAMIDVYGQTCTVTLLGSRKRCLFGTRKSCPTLAPTPACHGDSSLCVTRRGYQSYKKNPLSPELFENNNHCPSIRNHQCISDSDPIEECVACMSQSACVILCCGHQCLCTPCARRVKTDFGTCPLCRRPIT